MRKRSVVRSSGDIESSMNIASDVVIHTMYLNSLVVMVPSHVGDAFTSQERASSRALLGTRPTSSPRTASIGLLAASNQTPLAQSATRSNVAPSHQNMRHPNPVTVTSEHSRKRCQIQASFLKAPLGKPQAVCVSCLYEPLAVSVSC